MTDTVVESSIVDLRLWLDARERTYEKAMDAWRMSCPNLPVWEDANDRGVVVRDTVEGRRVVRVAAARHALLNSRGL